MKLQGLFSYCGDYFDPQKLRDYDVVKKFLLESGEILGMRSPNLYIRGATPTPDNPEGERIFKGVNLGSQVSIFADFVPQKNRLSLCVFHDELAEGVLDEICNLAEATFS